MKVDINGSEHDFVVDKLSYEDIVAHAAYRPGTIITITYHHRRPGEQRELVGSLTPGQVLQLEEGMRITAIHTGNA